MNCVFPESLVSEHTRNLLPVVFPQFDQSLDVSKILDTSRVVGDGEREMYDTYIEREDELYQFTKSQAYPI